MGPSMIGAVTLRAALDVELIDVNLQSATPSFFTGANPSSVDEAVSIRQDQFVIGFRKNDLSDPKVVSSLYGFQAEAVGMVDLRTFATRLRTESGYSQDMVEEIVGDYVLENGTMFGVCKEAKSHDSVKGGQDPSTTVQYHGQMPYINITGEFHTPGEQLEFFIPSRKLMDSLDYGRLTQDGLYVRGERPVCVRRVTTKNIADSLCSKLALYLENPDAAYELYTPDNRSGVSTISYCHDKVLEAQGYMLFGLNMAMKTLGLRFAEAENAPRAFAPLRDALLEGQSSVTEDVVANLGVALGFIERASDVNDANQRDGAVGRAMDASPDVLPLCRTLAGRIAGAQFMSVTKSRDSSLEFGDQVNPQTGAFLQNTATFAYNVDVYEPNITSEQGRMLASQKQFARSAIAQQGGAIYNRMKTKAGIVTKSAGPYDKGGIYRSDLGGAVIE